ncbi:tyrosine-type recombinase/integrase, partial [Shigella boydii]
RVFLVILFTSFSGSLVSRIPGAVHMMNGGNILTLQKILGHAKIQTTMIYAHLAPDYLQDAVRFNPLGGA